MDVLFLSTPYFPRTNSKQLYIATPLGLASLAAVLRENNFTVDILDVAALELDKESILKKIKKLTPRIIGITAISSNIDYVISLSNYIKSNYNCKIILGGLHATYDYDSLIKEKAFDYILVGEAEITIPKIVSSIISGEYVEKEIHGELPTNLDKLPIPAHDLLPIDRYFLPVTSKVSSCVESARGCCYSCKFCSIGKSKVRFKSVDRVIEELILLKSLGVGYIHFTDSIFTFHKKRVYKLCKSMMEQNLDLEWGVVTRCDLIDEELARTMAKAGCKIISFGVESGSFRIRKLLGKPITDEQILDAFRYCNKAKIQTGALFIIGAPTEIEEERQETLRMAKKLNPDYCQFFPLVLLPNTEIYHMALAEEKIEKNAWKDFFLNHNVPIYVPDNFSSIEEYDAYVCKLNQKFYIRPSYILKRLKCIRSYKDILRYVNYFSYLFFNSFPKKDRTFSN